MSKDVDSNKLVSNRHNSPRSEPVEGHGGTRYENIDATPGLIIYSLSIIAGTLVVVFFFTIFIQKYLEQRNPVGSLPSPLAPSRIIPPAPQLQVHPWEELPDMRAHENQVLNESGRDAEGHLHVPIDQAMDVVVSHLNVSPGAPQGITTPGGEGRAFAGSINGMPAPYQRPQIQGEIHKNAQ
jgi:hypothetical protein